MGKLRALLIPAGQTHDADGREVGDDWMMANCGSVTGEIAYVTTDRVGGSEFACSAWTEVLQTPTSTAEFLASAGSFWLGSPGEILDRVQDAYRFGLLMDLVWRMHRGSWPREGKSC